MLLDHGIVYAAAIGPCGRPTTNLSLALTKPLRDGGAEDTDLAVRLYNRGIRAKLGTCASYVLHLWHEANHNSVDGERKEALIQERIQSGTFMPERGLSTLKGDFLCAR